MEARRRGKTGSAQTPHGDLEKELRESLERYELIFRATHDVLYDLNLSTGHVAWNEALHSQFGYPNHELAGSLEWWVAHIHPDDAFRLENELTAWLLSGAQTRELEYRFRRADGSYTYVRDRGLVARDAANKPIRIIGSLLDITRQKNLDHAKDEFISLVSHQLRTPLTVIRTYGEMITAGFFGDMTEVQLRQVTRMTDASIRLVGLVDDILKVSRIELGDFRPSRTPIDVRRVIHDCIAAVMPLASDKGTAITFELDSTIPTISVDATVFTQILDNLLTNAVRYTRRQQGKIHVACSRQENKFVLSVADNGIGIPAPAQPHIFERFYRASNAVNITEHGTGLGLYLVRLLADTLGGSVWFTSKKNRGSTFYFAFPLEEYVSSRPRKQSQEVPRTPKPFGSEL